MSVVIKLLFTLVIKLRKKIIIHVISGDHGTPHIRNNLIMTLLFIADGNWGCLPFTKSFWEIQLESKWNTTFRVVSVENFRKQRYVWKGRSVFPVGIFQTEICVLFLQGHLWYQFQPFAAVFRGKWNWLEQMENSIPGRNLLVSKDSWSQNFAHYIAVCQCKW